MNARLHRRANRAYLIMATVVACVAVVISLFAPGATVNNSGLSRGSRRRAQTPHIYLIDRWPRGLPYYFRFAAMNPSTA